MRFIFTKRIQALGFVTHNEKSCDGMVGMRKPYNHTTKDSWGIVNRKDDSKHNNKKKLLENLSIHLLSTFDTHQNRMIYIFCSSLAFFRLYSWKVLPRWVFNLFLFGIQMCLCRLCLSSTYANQNIQWISEWPVLLQCILSFRFLFLLHSHISRTHRIPNGQNSTVESLARISISNIKSEFTGISITSRAFTHALMFCVCAEKDIWFGWKRLENINRLRHLNLLSENKCEIE